MRLPVFIIRDPNHRYNGKKFTLQRAEGGIAVGQAHTEPGMGALTKVDTDKLELYEFIPKG